MGFLPQISWAAARTPRRTATVTISAPEISWQARIVSKLEYLPVPTIRRANTQDESVSVLDAEAGSDRSSERHDRRRPCVFEFFCYDQVVVGVRKDDKAFFDENACRFQETIRVGV